MVSWGMKLGSVGKSRKVRLCYIDGFAGPWQAADAELSDTSIHIGLLALEEAQKTWSEKGVQIEVHAAFVEKDAAAFGELERYLASRKGLVRTRPCRGEFSTFVPELVRWIGADPAFVFVDPKGWKGAAMGIIAPLLGAPRRDVLVNVMFDHINRFKDAPHEFLREQMRDFFGLRDHDLPEGLDEEELFALYRENLKRICGIEYAADLAIPHPTIERTKFRLVVGGSDPAVIELFRSVEQRVMSREAAVVREDAANRQLLQKWGQTTLFATPADVDPSYRSLHDRGLAEAPAQVLEHLTDRPTPFRQVWPRVLETCHITKRELAACVWALDHSGALRISNKGARQRTTRDEHLLEKRR
ncbi:MAG: three-Cys-motif partner protein TcmP [Myxococcales bacterium]|nr:three-Cys-motif partner protein TcmP [Myxococcales bacterium]